MKLPNHQLAIIDPTKLRDYVLNPEHPRGKHKARVFSSALGFSSNDTVELIYQIREGIGREDCEPQKSDEFGQRFHVDVPIVGRAGTALVRTGWILLTGEIAPRLTTCFVTT